MRNFFKEQHKSIIVNQRAIFANGRIHSITFSNSLCIYHKHALGLFTVHQKCQTRWNVEDVLRKILVLHIIIKLYILWWMSEWVNTFVFISFLCGLGCCFFLLFFLTFVFVWRKTNPFARHIEITTQNFIYDSYKELVTLTKLYWIKYANKQSKTHAISH